MRTLYLFVALLFSSFSMHAQVTGSFVVGGDADKFYPVAFTDCGWNSNIATELHIGRSLVHNPPKNWEGSIIAKFRFHVTGWGSASNFIDADIKQYPNTKGTPLVGGWRDVTYGNASARIIIYLRGGALPYYYTASCTVSPVVYDTQPYIEDNNGTPITRGPLTAVEAGVNGEGLAFQKSVYFNSSAPSYFYGSVGIGVFPQKQPELKLAVSGTIGAKKVKVTDQGWADYVFKSDYTLPSLSEVEAFIKTNYHLPGIPSEKEIAEKGLDLGNMQQQQMQKIEELTLYIISLNKKLEQQEKLIEKLTRKCDVN
ncbi:hypothetical protein ECE50_010795 [Chitinophaga sp. Mgbs1]|uniref:Uncharacterized protein n=1 Tax=Chitinophaga solisilvae TaxID=1233460 RepID=A0A3S1D0P4_9BACT|nr:hypothetical protein [Chitinophaga solisilvae]